MRSHDPDSPPQPQPIDPPERPDRPDGPARGRDDAEHDARRPDAHPDPQADAEADDTGIRSLLSGLNTPELPSRNLTDRLRRSLSQQPDMSFESRQLPPLDATPFSRPRPSQRTLLLLAGATLAAGLVGAAGLSLISLPDVPISDVLATNTLRGAGIPVSTSGTTYGAETLPRQSSWLLGTHTTLQGGTSGATHGFARLTGDATTQGNPAVASAPASAGNDETERAERDVLACLRHLRIQERTVVAVDLATFEGRPAAVVVTTSTDTEPVTYTVRVIDPACPALGDPVLAGPTVLPSHP